MSNSNLWNERDVKYFTEIQRFCEVEIQDIDFDLNILDGDISKIIKSACLVTNKLVNVESLVA